MLCLCFGSQTLNLGFGIRHQAGSLLFRFFFQLCGRCFGCHFQQWIAGFGNEFVALSNRFLNKLVAGRFGLRAQNFRFFIDFGINLGLGFSRVGPEGGFQRLIG